MFCVNGEFWLAVLVSIPIGLSINLASPALSRVLSHFSSRIRLRRERRGSLRRRQLEFFVSHKTDYLAFLIRQAMLATLGAIAYTGLATAYMIYAFSDTPEELGDSPLRTAITALFLALSLIGSYSFTRPLNEAAWMHHRVLRAGLDRLTRTKDHVDAPGKTNGD